MDEDEDDDGIRVFYSNFRLIYIVSRLLLASHSEYACEGLGDLIVRYCRDYEGFFREER